LARRSFKRGRGGGKGKGVKKDKAAAVRPNSVLSLRCHYLNSFTASKVFGEERDEKMDAEEAVVLIAPPSG